MLARLDPRAARPRSGSRSGSRPRTTRARRRWRPGSRPPAARESQEVCFLAGGDYRDFLERRGLELRRRARSSPRRDGELGRHDGFWRYTPGQRKGLGVAAAEPLYALRTERARRTRSWSGRGARSRPRRVSRARPAVRARDAGRGEAPLPLARASPARRRRDEPRVPPPARRAGVRRRTRAGGGALRRRRRGRVGPRHLRRARLGSTPVTTLAFSCERRRLRRARRLPARRGPHARPTRSSAWAEPSGASPRSSRERRTSSSR